MTRRNKTKLFFCLYLLPAAVLMSMESWAVAEVTGIAKLNGSHINVELSNGHKLSVLQVQILDRLVSNVLSVLDGNDEKSELSKLNENGAGELSPLLLRSIRQCEAWRVKTQDRISCRIGKLHHFWAYQIESGVEQIDRREARKIARNARATKVDIVSDQQIKFGPDIEWNFDDFLGAIVLEELRSSLISDFPNVGFRLSHDGVEVFKSYGPNSDWELGSSLFPAGFTASVKNGASSSLKPWNRVRKVGRRELNGHFDGSSGWPNDMHASVTTAETAFDAVAQSTLASFVPAQQLFESFIEEGTFALLVAQDGRIQYAGIALPKTGKPEGSDVELQLSIQVEIPSIDTRSYNRPYVSVWISDKEQSPLRNLMVLGDQKRWLRELRVWWRRVGRRNDTVIDGVTGATRKPGQYQIIWDGRDDFGKPVTEPNVILHVEASRENGGRTYKKIAIDMSSLSGMKTLKSEGELGEITIYTNQPSAVSAR